MKNNDESNPTNRWDKDVEFAVSAFFDAGNS